MNQTIEFIDNDPNQPIPNFRDLFDTNLETVKQRISEAAASGMNKKKLLELKKKKTKTKKSRKTSTKKKNNMKVFL